MVDIVNLDANETSSEGTGARRKNGGEESIRERRQDRFKDT